MAQNLTLWDGTQINGVPSVELPKTGGGFASFDDTTDATATASDISTGKTAYVNGSKVIGTNSGGGASNFVTGTFTTGSSSGANSVPIPYTGNGYPVAFMVWVEGGMYNSTTDWYSTIKRYAVGQFAMTKSDTTSTPTYSGTGSANQGSVQVMYKSSTSSATTYSSTRSANATIYSGNANSTSTTVCRMPSKTSLSYYVIGSSNYGLMPSTTYRYIVYYSS